MLISFEGIDGCGKTTQSRRLYEHLKSSGKKVSLYREPGGTLLSERLREILISTEMTPKAELLLFEASRAELVAEKILRDLGSGFTVIMDRFTDSTLAYQGYGRGLDVSSVKELNRFASEGLEPDLTLLLDVEPELALKRLGRRTKFEDLSFLRRVREGYLRIAKENPNRVVVIPSHPPAEEVFGNILKILEERGGF